MNAPLPSIHGDLPPASISRRLLAQIIDSAIALLGAVVILLIARALGLSESFGVVAWLLYMLLSDGLPGGQSIGKRVMDIAVLHAGSREACSWGRSFLRNATLLVLGVIDIVFALGSSRRRLGDRLADTVVVRAGALLPA
ncbi:MAG: RDD family protein [Methyloversatilis sp.]|nr:RDD family protein [Methyloversatilis sp.]